MKRGILIGLLLIFSASLSFAQLTQTALVRVGNTTDKDSVFVSALDLEAFIYNTYGDFGGFHPHFQEINLMQVGENTWYLIGFSEPEQKFYALELLRTGRHLFLNAKMYMHQCPCEDAPDPDDIFLISEGKIVGCHTGSHTISVGEIRP